MTTNRIMCAKKRLKQMVTAEKTEKRASNKRLKHFQRDWVVSATLRQYIKVYRHSFISFKQSFFLFVTHISERTPKWPQKPILNKHIYLCRNVVGSSHATIRLGVT